MSKKTIHPTQETVIALIEKAITARVRNLAYRLTPLSKVVTAEEFGEVPSGHPIREMHRLLEGGDLEGALSVAINFTIDRNVTDALSELETASVIGAHNQDEILGRLATLESVVRVLQDSVTRLKEVASESQAQS